MVTGIPHLKGTLTTFVLYLAKPNVLGSGSHAVRC